MASTKLKIIIQEEGQEDFKIDVKPSNVCSTLYKRIKSTAEINKGIPIALITEDGQIIHNKNDERIEDFEISEGSILTLVRGLYPSDLEKQLVRFNIVIQEEGQEDFEIDAWPNEYVDDLYSRVKSNAGIDEGTPIALTTEDGQIIPINDERTEDFEISEGSILTLIRGLYPSDLEKQLVRFNIVIQEEGQEDFEIDAWPNEHVADLYKRVKSTAEINKGIPIALTTEDGQIIPSSNKRIEDFKISEGSILTLIRGLYPSDLEKQLVRFNIVIQEEGQDEIEMDTWPGDRFDRLYSRVKSNAGIDKGTPIALTSEDGQIIPISGKHTKDVEISEGSILTLVRGFLPSERIKQLVRFNIVIQEEGQDDIEMDAWPNERVNHLYKRVKSNAEIVEGTPIALTTEDGQIIPSSNKRTKDFKISEGSILTLVRGLHPFASGKTEHFNRKNVHFNSSEEAKHLKRPISAIPHHYVNMDRAYCFYILVERANETMTFNEDSDYFERGVKFGIALGENADARFKAQEARFGSDSFKHIVLFTRTYQEAVILGHLSSLTWAIGKEFLYYSYFGHMIGRYFPPGIPHKEVNAIAIRELEEKDIDDSDDVYYALYDKLLAVLKASVEEDLARNMDWQ